MNQEQARILLIEDNPGDADLLQEMLNQVVDHSFNLIWADELETGLRRLKTEPFDAVLLDLLLPDSEGLSTLATVQNRAPYVPIIVLMGANDDLLATQAVRQGAQDYLVKGNVTAQLLVRSIRYAIERKQIQEAMRLSEQQFRAIFRDSLDVILIIGSEEGRILQVNPAVRRVLGYHEESLIDKHFSTLFPPKSRPNESDLLEKIDIYGSIFESQVFRRVNGSICPMDLTATLIPWGRGEAILTTLRDVTERKKAENEAKTIGLISQLCLTTDSLETLYEEVPRILCQRFALPISSIELFDAQADEMVFVGACGFPPFPRKPLRVPRTETISGRVAITGQPIFETRAGWHDDYRFSFLRRLEVETFLCVPMKVGDQLLGALALADIHSRLFPVSLHHALQVIANNLAQTIHRKQAEQALADERALLARRVAERTAELRLANAELARAARLKDEFLANMSHELRTPLNAILGMSEALQEEVYGSLNEKQLRSVRMVEESGRHLLELINDILDLSKIETGKLDLEVTPVSVDSICQASLSFIKQTVHKKRLKVSLKLDESVTFLSVDERRLKQILINLLSNAVKFTPTGGRIGLEVIGHPRRRVVEFVIWDTGIGIAPADQKRLFQPFVQLDSSLSRKCEGTGLGLSLVYRLVEMHGGSLSLESEKSQGSRFSVFLPWGEDQATALAAESGKPERENRATTALVEGEITVLLAEDNEANRDTLTGYLTTRGYRVVIAENGADAVHQARQLRPDIILMDIQMPGMDGLEATRRIRTDDSLAHTPIIGLTALAMPGDRKRCLAAGVDEYLSKPVSLRGLAALMIQLVEEAD